MTQYFTGHFFFQFCWCYTQRASRFSSVVVTFATTITYGNKIYKFRVFHTPISFATFILVSQNRCHIKYHPNERLIDKTILYKWKIAVLTEQSNRALIDSYWVRCTTHSCEIIFVTYNTKYVSTIQFGNLDSTVQIIGRIQLYAYAKIIWNSFYFNNWLYRYRVAQVVSDEGERDKT